MASRPGPGGSVSSSLSMSAACTIRGEPRQRGIIGELEVVDEHLEGALAVAVVELGAGCVEGAGAFAGGDVEHLGRGDVEDLGVGIDEAADRATGRRCGRSWVERG